MVNNFSKNDEVNKELDYREHPSEMFFFLFFLTLEHPPPLPPGPGKCLTL